MARSLSEITRREDRIFVNLPVMLQSALQGSAVASGATVNYSSHGLRVRSSLPFEMGQEIGVAVRHEESRLKPYNVVWVRPPKGEKSLYEAGLVLQRESLI